MEKENFKANAHPYWEKDNDVEKMVSMHVFNCLSGLVFEIRKTSTEDIDGFQNALEEIWRADYDYESEESEEDPQYREIHEYWNVSDMLSARLEKHGEVVFQIFGMNVWGRQGTGQMLKLDGVIKTIASELTY